MLSPRALVKGNPARAKFAAENFSTCYRRNNGGPEENAEV